MTQRILSEIASPRSRLIAWVAAALVGCTVETDDAATTSAPRIASRVERRVSTGALSLTSLDDATLTSNGGIAIAADAGRLIAAFESASARWSILARRGDGPGEVRTARWVLHDVGIGLLAVDASSHRVLRWAGVDDAMHTMPLEGRTITAAWLFGDTLTIRYAPASEPVVLAAYGPTGDTIRTVRIPVRLPSSELGCGHCPAAVSSDGRIAIAVSDTSYRVLEYDWRGALLGEWSRRGVPLVPRSRREADSLRRVWDMVAGRISAAGTTTDAAQRVAELATQSTHHKRFFARGMHFDGSCLLLQRSVASEDSAAIDLFGRDRAFIGVIRLPPGARLHQARDGLLLSSQELHDGTFDLTVTRWSGCPAP